MIWCSTGVGSKLDADSRPDEMNTLNPVTTEGGLPADTIYKRAK
jgi:hypothetical protein